MIHSNTLQIPPNTKAKIVMAKIGPNIMSPTMERTLNQRWYRLMGSK